MRLALKSLADASPEGTIVLDLSGPITTDATLAFADDGEPGIPWIVNQRGIGLLGFAQEPVRTTLTSGENADELSTLALGMPYPNPTTGRVTVHLSGAAGEHVLLRAFDVLGRSMAVLYEGRSEDTATSLSLDLARFGPGALILVLEGEHRRAHQMVVLQ